ncbi:hypothetical protein [Pseudomonas aeruginosa]|uniref:hypothetical protein n=1 Tax=Pseudomonas aeruginosa TaxID=287 RepID=UPI0024C0B82A|nr:hypothetical protein [Pseudomonas aeruginosa]WHV73923.1 hypothetical protein M2I95_15600 [Pseudomonas aeruginosa]WHV73990.1 hypothetical protein M2I95_15985 [Pseudomonas aeruginosa]
MEGANDETRHAYEHPTDQAEQEALRKKAVEINKELVKRGMQPMKDSELVHAFLERVITSLEVGASGAIVQRED